PLLLPSPRATPRMEPRTPAKALGRLPSPAFSETSPSRRPITSPAGKPPPDWCSIAPEEWLLQFRQAVKSVVYRFINQIHKAMMIFEISSKTHYLHYQALEVGLHELWSSWKAFSQRKEIDEEVIGDSPLYFDFLNLVKKMRTPIGVSKRSEMEAIRMTSHALIEDVGKLQRAVTTA
ncbi:hypothetical protein FN846DRAFT_766111, partial [Sphaerosporella brunnea]